MARGELTAHPSGNAAGRIGCAAAAIGAGVLLQSLLWLPHVGWIPAALVFGLAALALLRPFGGLLVLAGLGPLAAMLIIATGQPAQGVQFAEALTLAFLTGAAARRAIARHPFAIGPRLGWPAVTLIAAAVASGFVQAAVLRAEQPALAPSGAVPVLLVMDYLVLKNAWTAAMQFAEGVLLLLFAAEIVGQDLSRRERIVGMMIVAAAGAAALNVLRVVTAAVPHDAFWTTLVDTFTRVRVNVHFADWNAAGSYFAMMLVVAAFAARGRARYAAAAVVIGAALWLTGSRTALGAVLLVAAGAGVGEMWRRGARRSAPVVAAMLLLAVVAAAGAALYPERRNDPAAFSFVSRMQLAASGLHMAVDHPVFGVGIGRFYALSSVYAGDVLDSFGRERENAHNYFVQVLAELGVPGFLLFAVVVASALRLARPKPGAPFSSWGVFAGLIVYLLTCFGGHPLMVPEAAYPFWMLAGVAASARDPRSLPRWVRAAAAAGVILTLAVVPARAANAARHADLSNTTFGLSIWHRDADGTRFRWAEARSTFFVHAAASGMIILLRPAPDTPPLVARVFLDGREANRVLLNPGEGWRRVYFVTGRRARSDYFRVDVDVEPQAPQTDARAGRPLLAIAQPTVFWDVAGADVPMSDVPLLGDLDGDGRSDLVVWSVTTGTWRWLPSASGYNDAAARSKRWREHALGATPLLGEIDGDGKADLVTWRAATGTWYWLTSSSNYSVWSAGSSQPADHERDDLPFLGDVDGDGKSDLIVWRPSSRSWHWLTSASRYREAGSLVRVWAAAGAAPIARLGDVDADGRAEFILWSVQGGPAAIEWASPSGAKTGTMPFVGRQPDDFAFCGDLDRDGRADPIMWAAASGTWTWRTSSSGFTAAAGERQWGNKDLGDVPVVADLDGDRAADLAVWRETTRTWYWITSASGHNPSAAGLKPWKF